MLKQWTKTPPGGVIPEGGTARGFKTGAWGVEYPRFSDKKCIQCLLCFHYCPENCIILDKNTQVIGTNLNYCKGCGLCAAECPTKARKMLPKKI